MTTRRAPLIAFLLANAISISGTRLSAIAIPWFVLISTGSAAKTGLVVVFELTPLVITKALGGPVIDRIGPRRISVVADLASTVLVAMIPLLHTLDLLSFPVLLVLVGLTGMTRGPGDTAKDILAPGIAEAARMPIERVTGLHSTVDRGAMIIAPALAGVLIAAVEPIGALLVDAASFAVCAVLIAGWGPRRPTSPRDPEDEAAGYLRRLRSGWRFLAHEPLLRAMVVMVCLTNLLDMAYQAVFVPVWIRDHGHGPSEIGLIFSAFGITATVGALLAAGFGQRLRRRATFLIGFLLCGAPRFAVLALEAPLWAVVAVSAVSGLGSGFLNPIIGAVYFERTPRRLQGRVFSMADSLAWAGMPLGGLLAGVAVTAIGLGPALLVAGGIYFAVTTAPAMLSRWKELDARPAAEQEPVSPGPAAAGGSAPRPEVPAG